MLFHVTIFIYAYIVLVEIIIILCNYHMAQL